ncbi:MAG: alpha-ketoglutarate-dependent dioxygenase AlkB [Alphaproteobacteria bacterium]|nr:alpha-ketoglutarate-dependent dioxygenase AlkB [Alphaproteobacteria bacterium]
MGKAAPQPDLFADGAQPPPLPEGVAWYRGRLSKAEQIGLLDDAVAILQAAPLFRPRMRNGTPLINKMTNCGALGWYSDEKGYRYIAQHPETGAPWPPIPSRLSALCDAIMDELGIAGYAPDACLVNAYGAEGRLNLHQDHDEVDFRWPIVSVSLGADALFVLGGYSRKDKVLPIRLCSGDVVVLYGKGRTLFHGVKKVFPGTSPVSHPALNGLARINFTLRRAR